MKEEMDFEKNIEKLHNILIEIKELFTFKSENIKKCTDEKREIAKYLTQKLNSALPYIGYYIMTKDKAIYNFDSYRQLLKTNEISPDNAYVYVLKYYSIRYNQARYFYPFLIDSCLLLNAYLSKYLSKQDFSSIDIEPATGLKYIAVTIRFPNGHMVVEIADVDNVAIKLKLPTLKGDDIKRKFIQQLNSQKLFAGYSFNVARDIIDRYYENHDPTLAKKVESIRNAYNYIFNPYRLISSS